MQAGCWHFNCCHPDLLGWMEKNHRGPSRTGTKEMPTLALAARAVLVQKLMAAGLRGTHPDLGQTQIWTCFLSRLMMMQLLCRVMLSTLWFVAR